MFELLQLSLYTAGGEPVPVEMLLEITLDAPVGMLGFAPYANPAPGVRQEWHGHLVDAGSVRACRSSSDRRSRACAAIAERVCPARIDHQ